MSRGARRVALPEAAWRLVDEGRLVRVTVEGEALLVGRPPGSTGLLAYANRCAHQDVPLEAGLDDPEDPGAPYTDDGVHLICLRHGALYRPADGLCVEGPCAGARLQGLALTLEDRRPFLLVGGGLRVSGGA